MFFETETQNVMVYIQIEHSGLICAVYCPCLTPRIGYWLGVVILISRHTHRTLDLSASLVQKVISNTMRWVVL